MAIIPIEEQMEHEVCELICVKCFHRYIGVYPAKTLLKDLECENCGKGYIIKTGQTLEDTQENEWCKDCKFCVNGKCKLAIVPYDTYCKFYRRGK